MNTENIGDFLEASTVLHNQAVFEADTNRRQRNGFIAGTMVSSVITGVLQGAEVVNDVTVWGPRFVSGCLLVGVADRWLKNDAAKTRAKDIANKVAIEATRAGVLPPSF